MWSVLSIKLWYWTEKSCDHREGSGKFIKGENLECSWTLECPCPTWTKPKLHGRQTWNIHKTWTLECSCPTWTKPNLQGRQMWSIHKTFYNLCLPDFPPPTSLMGSRSQASWAQLPYKDGAASKAARQKLAMLWCQPSFLYHWSQTGLWLHCTAVYTCILIVQPVLLNSAPAELSNTVNFIHCNFKQALNPSWIEQYC